MSILGGNLNSLSTEEHQIKRFRFGKNWLSFSNTVTTQIVDTAVNSMKDVVDEESLVGKTFLDIGSGSGLFSLAANRLGASVRSFDYDTESVECTKKLRQQYANRDLHWEISQGSILDETFLKELGVYDVVYAWGVLHHTGHLELAMQQCV